MERIIFHVDVNSAFLSWEAAYRVHHLGKKTDLRAIPSVVGGDQEKRHGIVLAKSIPTKQYKIKTGEPVAEAKRKCPDLVVVPPNYELYNRSSQALLELLGQFTDRIEQYSIDEAFLDMTGCCEDPLNTAYTLKDIVQTELGFTVNVGVSSNKLLAKMASDFTKPDRVHTLWMFEVQTKMWPLPVGELFYVGPASERKLRAIGIRTIRDLAITEDSILSSHLKSHGLLIKQYANGIDFSEVIPSRPANKGYGNSLTTPVDVCDSALARKYLLSLAETVSARLRADNAKAGVVSLSLRDCDLHFSGHQLTLPVPTDLTTEIYAAASKLFDELWTEIPIRHLGIHTSRISYDDFRQLDMFSKTDYEKQKKMEEAVDTLRKRFGQDSIMRASFLPSSSGKGPWIDHMGGGISREKRSVDYSKDELE